MSRNTQVVDTGSRNALAEGQSVSFSRDNVDTDADGQLTITVDGLQHVDRASVEATSGSHKAAAVPQSGDDVVIVILNDSGNTPVTGGSNVTGIEGVASGQ